MHQFSSAVLCAWLELNIWPHPAVRFQCHGEHVDILIDIDPLAGLEFVTLAEQIEQWLGLRVELVSRRAIKANIKYLSVKTNKERIRRYRRYVYEAGSLNRPEKGGVKVIEEKILEKERSKDFKLSRNDRFRYRTRYFTDSGIIGSKEFVSEHYQRFKHLFYAKHEKNPKTIKGLDGMHSLKRLSELI